MPIMLMLVHIQQTSVSHFFHWTGANVGHQNSLRPSALDKEQSRVRRGHRIEIELRASLHDVTCATDNPRYSTYICV